MSTQAAILTQGLTKSYGSVRALRGIDLEVFPGETFGFLGPNGAGKTTTIRCLLDMIRPDSGTLSVLGLNPQTHAVAVHARTGYLPGELHFDEAMSVGKTLRYLNALRGNRADWSHVCALAERLDLELEPPIKNLSKGNKQKVGVVQALMHEPELLLLDEPTAGLDPLLQQEVLQMIKEASRDGATVFFSSHILSEVQEIANRVGIIRQGELVEVAETQALVHRSLQKVRLRFRAPVPVAELAALPGVTVLSESDGLSLLLQVEGEMDGLIKAAARFPVVELETERPSLEEVFLAYYKA